MPKQQVTIFALYTAEGKKAFKVNIPSGNAVIVKGGRASPSSVVMPDGRKRMGAAVVVGERHQTNTEATAMAMAERVREQQGWSGWKAQHQRQQQQQLLASNRRRRPLRRW